MNVAEQVQASLNGDREAFGAIVSRYQGVVCATAYSVTGNVHQSEDVAQEAFVVAWQRLGDLRDAAKLPAWLCGIARNLAHNLGRRMQRDPLRHAEDLSAENTLQFPDLAATLDHDAREALVWKTIEAIPPAYREPLVLYYREGHSVRDVAEALDVTEDCAKQRLARARKLVKSQVAGLVETTLEQTRPQTDLSTAVMGLLPMVAVQSSMSGAVGASTLKGASGGVASVGAAAAAGLAGPVLGFSGAFLGMWLSIRNCPTLRARRYMLKCIAFGWAEIWVFLGYLGACSALFSDAPDTRYLLSGIGWVVYMPAILLAILFFNQRLARIVKEDFAETIPPIEKSSLSLRTIWISFWASLIVAAIASAGAIWWLDTVPGAGVIKMPAIAVLALAHFGYAMLFRHGVRISYDQAAFDANPPIMRFDSQTGAPRPSSRAVFWNSFGALFGAIMGPMAGPIVLAFVSGRIVTGIVELVVSIAVIAFGVSVAQSPARRRMGFVYVCVFMGWFCGGAWMITASNANMSAVRSDMNPYWIAAIATTLFWVMAGVLYFVLPRNETHRTALD